MIVVFVFEEDVLRLVCGYAPQSGRSLEEKQSFYDELKCEWYLHSVFGVGQRNLEGRMLLVLAGEGIMCIKCIVYERGKEEIDI